MTKRLACAVFVALMATTAFAQSFVGFDDYHSAVDEDGGTVQMTVIRTGSLTGAASVDYYTSGGDAVANVDYTPLSGTLHFGNGESEKTITLTVFDNGVTDPKPHRLVGVYLQNYVHCTYTPAGGHPYESITVEIKDDEPPPPPLTLSYGNLTHSEGDGVANTYITVNLNRPHDQTIAVSFRPYGNVGADPYNGARPYIRDAVWFEPGQTTKQVPLEIRGNDTYDGAASKSFHFGPMFGPVAVVAANFDIILTEDDPIPTLSVADISVPEGSCEPTPIEVTITSDAPFYGLVHWTTSDGTATTADVDYGPYGVHEPVYMLNATTAKITLVAPYGDLKIEDDETFSVTLTGATNWVTGATNGTIGDGTATVTIENDDEEPPSFLEELVRIEAGTEANLTINFPAPAPKGTVLLSSSDEHVKVPASVEVPERATSVSFTADATEAVGRVVITANLAGQLGDTQLNATVDAFRDSDLRFQGPRRVAFAGETAMASITLDPPRTEEVTVALTASPGIVVPDSVIVPPGGAAEFPFTSLAAGEGSITAISGELTNSLVIDIAAQQFKSFAPDLAPTTGGTMVTLKGIGFSSACTASFDNVAAQTTFVDAQTLIAKAPVHAAEAVNLTVTCGVTPVTATNAFRFANARRRASRH